MSSRNMRYASSSEAQKDADSWKSIGNRHMAAKVSIISVALYILEVHHSIKNGILDHRYLASYQNSTQTSDTDLATSNIKTTHDRNTTTHTKPTAPPYKYPPSDPHPTFSSPTAQRPSYPSSDTLPHPLTPGAPSPSLPPLARPMLVSVNPSTFSRIMPGLLRRMRMLFSLSPRMRLLGRI